MINSVGASRITNREVVNAFRNLVADRIRISDDSGISTRLSLYNILRQRAFILSEKMRARRILSKFNYQTIPCIELCEIQEHECPCAPNEGYTFLKTKLAVPKPVYNFKSVTSIDGSITYDFVEWDKFVYKINSRIKAQSSAPYYTVKTIGDHSYIYVYNDEHKKFVTVTAIYENPIQVQLFPDCEGKVNECARPLDLEFIIDPDLLSVIMDMTFDRHFRPMQTFNDTVSNDNDDVSQPQVPPK